MQLEEQMQTELDTTPAYAVLSGIDLSRARAVREVIAECRHRQNNVINKRVGHATILAVEHVKDIHSELHRHSFADLRVFVEAHIDVVHGLSAETRVAPHSSEWSTEDLCSIQVVIDPAHGAGGSKRAVNSWAYNP